ncbi:nitroreductase [Gottschalkia purinilytica]|uniref:Nitroreductase n=1 Tax=Gottschalkia purinilytica TaxID=1503 RepID=A0A0L0W8A6_GOTPU|nr:nitroreductase family protein [Gottschalkia purinilytica]KNF07784.1 nitroreductase [Gottschalkia purinilytica]
MNLFDAIYLRKSIRKYNPQKLSKDLLIEIENLANSSNVLYEEIDMKVHLVEDGEKIQKIIKGIIGSYGKIIAPHYLVVTSEEKDGHLENVGFAIEEVILKLTTMGIATCWIGGHIKPELLYDIVDIPQNHAPVILVSFGYPKNKETFLRQTSHENKRKKLSEIIEEKSNDTWDNILDAARVAPSAVNSQPWRFVVEDQAIHTYVVKRSNFITKKVLERINQIDIGIALSHINIASSHFDKNIEFKKLHQSSNNKNNYVMSVVDV